MSFKDCIDTAVESGRLAAKKADEAKAVYDRMHEGMLKAGKSETEADTGAGLLALQATTELKSAKRWQRINEMRKADKIFRELEKSKTPGKVLLNYGNLLDLKYDRVRAQAMAGLDTFILKYMPKATGVVPVDNLDNIVRAAYGDVRNAEAETIAKAIDESLEWLRQRANMEGAAIPKNENRRLPQTHDRLKVRKAERGVRDADGVYVGNQWVEDHLERLDWDMMRYHGLPVEEADRRLVLSRTYDAIITNGYSTLKPGQHNNTPLAGRLARDRFLWYKDGDAWLEMQGKYGSGNVYSQIIGMIDSMAKDISTMEVLGPNPNTMKNFAENAAKHRAGILETASDGKGKSAVAKVNEDITVWNKEYNIHNHLVANGEENVMAQTVATLRTVTLAAKLGGVYLASLGDIGISKWARRLNGLPESGVLRAYFNNFVNNKVSAQQAIRAGVVFESGISLAHSFQRYFGALDGPHWARRFSDFVFRSSLATLHTQTVSNVAGLELLGFFADHAAKKFDDLPFAAALRAFDISEKEWDLFRATPLHNDRGATFLRPLDAFNAATDEAGRQAADKFGDFMQQFIRMSSPRPDLRTRAFLGHDVEATSVLGQFVKSVGMLKAFPATLFFNHLQAINNAAPKDKLALGARFFLYLTIGGAFVTQVKALAAGRDPYNMNPIADPASAADFWGRAVLNGGSLGILGDFVFNNINIANSRYSVDGPLEQNWKAFQKLTFDNLIDLTQGRELNLGADFTQAVNAFAPKIWYTRVLMDRAIEDVLLKETDPAAYRRMQRYARKHEQETGQGRFVGPDGIRTPDIANAVGE